MLVFSFESLDGEIRSFELQLENVRFNHQDILYTSVQLDPATGFIQPNPVQNIGLFQFETQSSSSYSLQISSYTGKIMSSSSGYAVAGSYTVPIDASALPEGFYLCVLSLDSGDVHTAKMMVIKQ